jgi:hypothetical protein
VFYIFYLSLSKSTLLYLFAVLEIEFALVRTHGECVPIDGFVKVLNVVLASVSHRIQASQSG